MSDTSSATARGSVNVFVVTDGTYVMGAYTARSQAMERATKEAVAYTDATEVVEREETEGRSEIFYKSKRSGRWNRSKVFITETELNR